MFHILVEVESDPIALRGELTGRFKILEEKDLSRFGVIISDGKVCVVPGGLIRLLQDKTFPVKLFEIDPRTWIFPAFLCRAGAQWVPGGDHSLLPVQKLLRGLRPSHKDRNPGDRKPHRSR